MNYSFVKFLKLSKSLSNFITNRITSWFCYFWMSLFEVVLNASVVELFSMINKFFVAFTNQVFTYIFNNFFIHIFSKRQKFTTFYKSLFDLLVELNISPCFILWFRILISKPYFNIWKFWVKKFLKIQNSWVIYLIIEQMIY